MVERLFGSWHPLARSGDRADGKEEEEKNGDDGDDGENGPQWRLRECVGDAMAGVFEEDIFTIGRS